MNGTRYLKLCCAAMVVGLTASTALHAPRSCSATEAADGSHRTTLPGAHAVTALAGGGALCATDSGQFLSVNDPTGWTALSVPSANPAVPPAPLCVGGSRERIFFVMPTERSQFDYAVYSFVPGGKLLKARQLPGLDGGFTPVAFRADKIGAISTGANLGVTLDGGVSWHPSPPLFDDASERVGVIKWAGASRILVSGRVRGAVSLYDVGDGGSVHRKWLYANGDIQGNFGAAGLAVDEEHCWVIGKAQFRRLRLADGVEDYSIPRQNSERMAAALHGALLAWTPEWIQANWIKADGTVFRSRRFPVAVAAVLPLDKPRCLVLSRGGEGLSLDAEAGTLRHIDLRVSPTSGIEEESPEARRDREARVRGHAARSPAARCRDSSDRKRSTREG